MGDNPRLDPIHRDGFPLAARKALHRRRCASAILARPAVVFGPVDSPILSFPLQPLRPHNARTRARTHAALARDAGLTLTIGLRVIRDQHADAPGLLSARRDRPRSCRTYTTDQLHTATVPTEVPGTSDAALIQPIAAGDKGAMRILFARHNVRLFRFLLRFVGDRLAAEDFVSEVFLEVWRQAGSFQGRSEATT